MNKTIIGWWGLVLMVLVVGMAQSGAQISTSHVGSFNWRGGGTNRGGGEFLYGTLTIGSNGKIFSSYFVPRYQDRNSFSGLINLSTGLANVTVRVNGRPSHQGQIRIRSKQQIGFDGTFGTSTGRGLISGFR